MSESEGTTSFTADVPSYIVSRAPEARGLLEDHAQGRWLLAHAICRVCPIRP